MQLRQPKAWQIGIVLGLGVLSVSTSAIFVRLALSAANESGVGFSLVMAAARLGIATIALAPVWRTLKAIPSRQALGYSGAAGLFLAIHFATWITSLSYTSIAASATLVTTNPVWVALLSWWWYREKPSLTTTIGIGITLAGSALVAFGGEADQVGTHPLLGNALALVGSWMVSLYFLLGREAQQQGQPITTHIVITYTTAAIVLLPLPFLFGATYTGYPLQVYGWIGLMALFPQLIGHTSFNWAVRWISPTLVTLTILAEPVGSSLLGAVVFQENPGVTVILGAAVLLSGVATAAVGSRSAASELP